MDSVKMFGHRDEPEECFLRTAAGFEVVIGEDVISTEGFDLDPTLFLTGITQMFYQDGMVHLTVFIDEEESITIELATVPNCESIHDWIRRANHLATRRQE